MFCSNKTIEAFGTGFKRIFSLCDNENIKYTYKNEGLGFSFIFERNITSLLYQDDRINDKIKNQITGSTLDVYEYLLKNDRINNAEHVTENLNKSIITIQRGLKKLINLGLVERIGSNKTGYWKVLKK